jgi:hypothetical protein
MDPTRLWEEFLYVYLGNKLRDGASGVSEALVIVATAACLIMLGWRLVVRRVLPAIRRRRRGTMPQCRSCGYAIEGLPSTTCPECGSDLRGTGTCVPAAAPPPPRPVGRVRRILAWTLLIVIYYPFAVQLLPPLAPRPIVQELQEYPPLAIRRIGTQGRTISRCSVDAEWRSYLPFLVQPPFIYLEVWTEDQSRPPLLQARRIQIGPGGSTYGFVDAKGHWRQGDNLDEQVILEFLQAAGADSRDPSLQSMARQLLPLLKRTSSLHLQWNPTPLGKKDKYHSWIAYDWLALWLLGVLRILWRGRKVKPASPAPQPALQTAQAA